MFKTLVFVCRRYGSRCELGSNSHVISLPGKRRSGSPHEGGDKAKKRVSQFSNAVGWGGGEGGVLLFPLSTCCR